MMSMKQRSSLSATIGLAALALLLPVSLPRLALADEAPPASTAPGNPGAGGRHHENDPAWQACRKQADDQKLAPGDARREFMKDCVKKAKAANPPTSS